MSTEELKNQLIGQKKRVEELNRFIENYPKYGKDRRAKEEFYSKKLEQLQSWWVNFEKEHQNVLPHLSDDQPYVNEKTFENAAESYKKLRDKIQQELIEFKNKKKRDQPIDVNDRANASTSKQTTNENNDDNAKNETGDEYTESGQRR